MTQAVQGPKLLDAKQAAAYLGFDDPRDLRNLRNRGCGPAYHQFSDRVFKYSIADLDAYLEAVREEPPQMPRPRAVRPTDGRR